MKKVTVIIPNFNGESFLEPCLDALRKQSMAGFDIIVVDDGSFDGSLKLLGKYPEARVIQMKKNTGFCKAVNTGVMASKTEYVLLLNNDTVADKYFVESLVSGIDKRPNAFSCGSLMLSMSNPQEIDDAGDLYNAFGWAFARGKGRSTKRFDKTKKIFSACAGAAIYRRNLFIKLGMLDENHFAYLEDLDIGYRARIYGYENWYIPEAKVFHVGSGSSGSRYNEFKISHSARNNIYIIYKNMPFLQRVINAPFHVIGFGIKKIYFKRKGFGELYKNSLAEGKRLALTSEGKSRHVPFSAKNFKNYCVIQLELWANIFRGYSKA